MADTGLRTVRSEAMDAARRPAWSPWKSLLPAFIVSVLAHLVVLLGVALHRSEHAPRPVLVVTFTSATLLPAGQPSPPAAAPLPTAPPPAQVAPAPQPEPPASPPAAPAPPQAATTPAIAAPLPPPPAAEPVPAPESAPAQADSGFRPAEELAQAPTPQADPELQALAPQLVSRRLQITLWIDAAGRVQQADVRRNELSPELATLLEQAMAQVRFTPGLAQDQPTGAVLRTLLCFDHAGLLDASSDECWKPHAATGR